MKYPVPVSVVMPCYNSGRYVSDAIESILHQTFADFELIIVDDGSTDSSNLAIAKFNDSRIRFFQLKENKGNYFARNYGMQHAKGKYVCVMDADDIACPGRLETQYRYMNAHPRTGAIGGQAELIDENGMLLNRKISGPRVSRAQLKIFLLMNNCVIHPTLMVRNNLLKRHHIAYNEQYRYSSDYDFVSRCADLFPVCNIEDTLIAYRVHGAQISTGSRMAQSKYADQIRILRLKAFEIRFAKFEETIYLSIMKGVRLSSLRDLEKGIALFNRILSANLKLKIYNHRLLYEFFDYILSKAKDGNQEH